MGCFCRRIAPEPADAPDGAQAAEPVVPLVSAVGTWLAARWLPPALPWKPDPAWLDLDLPTLPVPPASLAVLSGLATARKKIGDALGLDPLLPGDAARLSRIVSTLNRRTEQLRPAAEDRRPWQALAGLNDAADTVRRAQEAGLFDPGHQQFPPDRGRQGLPPSLADPSRPAWRALLAKLLALAPLVATANTLRLDLADPGWVDELAGILRQLRQVVLPALADPAVVMGALARDDAMARLRNSVGPQPYADTRRAVASKLRDTLARLPPAVRLQDGKLQGMPDLQPNPSLVVNAATVAAAAKLTPGTTSRLTWRVPEWSSLPLLTVGAPVASLVAAMTAADAGGTGERPVRSRPCDAQCDAKAAQAAA